jgi:tagatose-1,6-bisphosphate aldolase non-catalytic subunit AgaZ/GatZ
LKNIQKNNMDIQIIKFSDIKPIEEKAPPGWEGTVKAMKKEKKITNPFALAWYMKNKGDKSHVKEAIEKKNTKKLKSIFPEPVTKSYMANVDENVKKEELYQKLHGKINKKKKKV